MHVWWLKWITDIYKGEYRGLIYLHLYFVYTYTFLANRHILDTE